MDLVFCLPYMAHYHKVVNEKRSLIKELKESMGTVVQDNETLSKKVTRFYKKLYIEDIIKRPSLVGLD